MKAGLGLPPHYMHNGLPQSERYINDLAEFLCSPFPSSIIRGHPNQVAVEGPPEVWGEWWNSAWIDDEGFDLDGVLKAIISNDESLMQLPPTLYDFLQSVHRITLPRDPDPEYASSVYTGDSPPPAYMRPGMSVKKAHEIEQLASLIGKLAQGAVEGTLGVNHVVDVGAGQGYLARSLASHPYSMQVLALDSDGHQTKGAERRNTKKGQKIREDEGGGGGVMHATVFVDSDTLPEVIDTWIPFQEGKSPVPVIITGLHACGSLTPAVIRAVISIIKTEGEKRGWYCKGLAIVGCCYNRATRKDDFPLSQYIRNHHSIIFTEKHLQLAAQTPSTWPQNWDTARFGLRKVAMRALLGKSLTEQGHAAVLETKQVGKLNDKVFATWAQYYNKASEKLGLNLEWSREDAVKIHAPLVRRLEFFHVLRCMLGPVIESLIVMDRWTSLKEGLEDECTVRMVNVFDQSTGSVRNVALVAEMIHVP